MTEKLVCPICGAPTRVYMGNARKDRLCATHAEEFKAGIILKCDNCEEWHPAAVQCKCKKDAIPDFSNYKSKEKKESFNDDCLKANEEKSIAKISCIICGKDSSGLHFCKECYSKYKDRAVDIRITHCKDTEVLDEYGNLIYTCDDGRKVRSRAESIICSWLYNNKIRVKYEEAVYYINEKTKKTEELHPDFYLPDYNLYIEYNELENPTYLKSKEYTKQIYEKLNLEVLVMTPKELQNVTACLKPILFAKGFVQQ